MKRRDWMIKSVMEEKNQFILDVFIFRSIKSFFQRKSAHKIGWNTIFSQKCNHSIQ